MKAFHSFSNDFPFPNFSFLVSLSSFCLVFFCGFSDSLIFRWQKLFAKNLFKQTARKMNLEIVFLTQWYLNSFFFLLSLKLKRKTGKKEKNQKKLMKLIRFHERIKITFSHPEMYFSLIFYVFMYHDKKRFAKYVSQSVHKEKPL